MGEALRRVIPSLLPLPGEEILTVSQLTAEIKARLEGYPRFRFLWVRGEISNFKRHSSGHLYFTLKDQGAAVRCVMFRSAASGLSFVPASGLEVIAAGSLKVYEAGGEYELVVEALVPAGVGQWFIRFEELKRKLAAEGLFAAERKRPLPFFPRRVGVVTSPTGAAIRDIIKVLSRRAPGIEVLISPCLVQGEGAPASIIRALQRLLPFRPEVVIVGRGGGSVEDLQAFNDEELARAIAAYPYPVVSAVGHEIDFTIADFVADQRAPTPSAAAEMVVPDRRELRHRVQGYARRLELGARRFVDIRRLRVERLLSRPVWRRPLDLIHERRRRVDDVWTRAEAAVAERLAEGRERLALLAGRLEGLNPLAVLARGYAVCERAGDGRLVARAGQVTAGDELRVRFVDGAVECVAQAVHEEGEGEAGCGPSKRLKTN
ncbi:MAG TPA: exodeoxyribonuclease VII large subunit [Firmicutes bacterium]|nr:exodeoxyribonuclease VII large subunit [Bacillota bacterium]